MFKANRLLVCAILLPLLASGLIAGCGYQSLHRMRDNIPGVAAGEPVAVQMAMWSNLTNELGLESLFFNTVANWLQGSDHILLKKDPGQADYLLTGTISAIDLSTSRGTVHLTVRYSLKNRETGTVVWPETNQVFSKSYLITADAGSTRTERQQALTEIADDLGEKIYIRFLYALPELRQKGKPAPAGN
ncbi:MAG: LPS assembly lipoprotein LptE [Desulfobulbaceae bacterium]|nr:LPS assembly lipoprotein LptE [Desulfobulbaceae bacterium]